MDNQSISAQPQTRPDLSDTGPTNLHSWPRFIANGIWVVLYVLGLVVFVGLRVRNRLRRAGGPPRRSKVAVIRGLPLVSLIAVALTGCAGWGAVAPAQSSQPPAEYLSNALDWIEAHAILLDRANWEETRREALSLVPDPQKTADTYPALRLALRHLRDWNAFLVQYPEPGGSWLPGLLAIYPEGIVVRVEAGGPAERAGVRVGDVVESVNEEPPQRHWEGGFLGWGEGPARRLRLKRAGQDAPITVTFDDASFPSQPANPTGRRIVTSRGGVGYIDLPMNEGTQQYPTVAQRVLRDVDQTPICGWIIDLRLNFSGDIWSYLAAVGPILGEGDVGGFVYPSGNREPWAYRNGKVLWNGQERWESSVDGSIYRLKRPMPPVALLTSRATTSAGELVAVAFQGRPKTRRFGEPTAGFPYLAYWTPLSDGASISVSGAFSMDRTGRIYDGPIPPDQPVAIDWTTLGTDGDPVVRAAVEWLQTQPECADQGEDRR